MHGGGKESVAVRVSKSVSLQVTGFKSSDIVTEYDCEHNSNLISTHAVYKLIECLNE